MPTRDRYWRAQLIGGGAAIVVALIAAIILWVALIGIFLLSDLSDPAQRLNIVGDLFGSVIFPGILILQGVGFWRAGLRARTRFRMRVAAMNGDPDAMPLVRGDISVADPADAPDVRSESLSLTKRTTGAAYMFYIPVFGFFAAVFLALAGIPIYLFMAIMTTPSLSSMSWEILLLGYGLILVLFGVAVFVAGFLISYLFDLRRLHGIVASDEGIMYYPSFKKPHLLRWEDLRLLEIAMPERDASRNPTTYIAHGLHGDAEWASVLRNNSFETFGVSDSEIVRRQQALLDLIAARTGLRARSCNRELWDDYTPSKQKNNNNLLGCSIFAAALFVPAVVLIVFGGLTSSPVLNVLVAGILITLLLLAIISALRTNLRRNDHGSSGSLLATTGPITTMRGAIIETSPTVTFDSATTYAIAYGSSALSRLRYSIVGLLLLVCAAPAVSGLFAFLLALLAPTTGLAFALLPWLPVVNGAPGIAGSLLLLPIGVAGFLMLFATLRSDRTVIIANRDGLRWRRRRKTQRLAWREIASVEAQLMAGRLIRYVATNSGASVSVSWYADLSVVRPLTPRDLRRIGAPAQSVQPIMPLALTTLVQERSGVALTHGERLKPSVLARL